MKLSLISFFIFSQLVSNRAIAQSNNMDTILQYILSVNGPQFNPILKHKDEWNVQIIYSQVDYKKGKPQFTDHYFNVDPGRYYYPASTVKLPIALLAMQKLNELAIPGLDMNSTMITGSASGAQTEVYNDPSAADGRPTIAHYIKKILLVSDNDAFNRLYEFLGQEYINRSLQQMGYTDVEIIHRLDISLSEEENRKTNPVSFYDKEGHLLYQKPAENSGYVYHKRTAFIGKGYMRGGQLVNEPMDFSKKNCFPLEALHSIVRTIIFPESVPKEKRFNLRNSDQEFLLKYMSMMPPESVSPVYDSAEYWDTYVKFLFYGQEKNRSEPGIKIYNKVGDAYGFLIDGAYIRDTVNKVDFFLSAVIYCNSDGVLNDDHYDYGTLGFPFMKNLGRAVHTYELTRPRRKK